MRLDVGEAMCALRADFGCERLTIQSGGTVNGLFLREKLIDCVDIVVAPVLIGGKDTATLIDGSSITSADDLPKVGVLKLTECTTLKDSYIRLRYEVIG
ncbi:MAG: dihydrofolate reductase family protein [Oscillospiraceae bacterium]|nr:dihydrofolate reductase family protein [Oscillospiraceae bacterium]